MLSGYKTPTTKPTNNQNLTAFAVTVYPTGDPVVQGGGRFGTVHGSEQAER